MRVGIATSGLWRLRDAVEVMTGGVASKLPPHGWGVDAIAGWGHKPTANQARSLARLRGIPYVAFEDGFLRSVNPGNSERPLSMVMDRTGIYYDARQPSDLEALIRKRAFSPQPTARVLSAVELLRTSRLSKYNNCTIDCISALGLKAPRSEDRVLVIDQTVGDASITGALANDETFPRMLEAAIKENLGAEILVRIHPETMMGRKAGHFGSGMLQKMAMTSPAVARALRRGLLRLTPEPINPWALLEGCSQVYCVSSQLGFEGLIADCTVHCFGMPFYGGWGLTRDRCARAPAQRKPVSRETLIAAVYFDYCHFVDFQKKQRISLETAIDCLESRIRRFV